MTDRRLSAAKSKTPPKHSFHRRVQRGLDRGHSASYVSHDVWIFCNQVPHLVLVSDVPADMTMAGDPDRIVLVFRSPQRDPRKTIFTSSHTEKHLMLAWYAIHEHLVIAVTREFFSAPILGDEYPYLCLFLVRERRRLGRDGVQLIVIVEESFRVLER